MERVMKMNGESKLPKRKHPRLDHFDYSSSGAYFITICTHNRRCTLSRIVGRGLAPAETDVIEKSIFGEIAERQLLLLEERYPHLTVDHYVIMPNHIHAILLLNCETAGASPRPTIMDIVCAYKSLTTIECKKNGLSDKLFQSSFFEHVVRGREDYNEIRKYIYENPVHWVYDELYSKE
jgi:REP element-mobilizing transposase RayT